MTTKLEAVVGYLAGRESDPSLLEELANPSSDASCFLEATRSRSRALLDPPSGSIPTGREVSPTPTKRRGRLGSVGWVALAILGLGVLLGVGEVRGRRLETLLIRAEEESRARQERLESTLSKLVPPRPSTVGDSEAIRAALGKVDSGLTRLEQQLQVIAGKQEIPKVDSSLAEVRDQLSSLRREVTIAEKTRVRGSEELQSSIHEVSRLLRLLITRSQPAMPADGAAPAFPNPRQPSGGDLGRRP